MSPLSVLAEIQAKRKIISDLDTSPCVICGRAERCYFHDERSGGPARERYLNPATEQVLSALADVYANHPDR